MKTNLTRIGAITAILLLTAAVSLQAKTIEFPEKDPAFTFTIPESWTTEPGKDGRIYCTAEDGFKIGVVSSPGVKSAEDAKELLPKILKGMADAMKCEDYKPGQVHARELRNIWMSVMQGRCESEGTDMSLNAVVFSLSPGKYFSLVGAAPTKLDKAHNKDMDELIRSIKATGLPLQGKTAPGPLQGKTIKFPADNPDFSFKLPDGWTMTADKDGDLVCKSGDEPALTLNVNKMGENFATVKEQLPELGKTFTKAAEMKNVEAKDLGDDTNKNGVKGSIYVVKGKSSGQLIAAELLAIEPKDGGDAYFMMFSGLAPAMAANADAIGAIIDSIKPVK